MDMIVKPEYRGTPAYFHAFRELLTAALYHGTVSYTRIAEATGLPTSGNLMGKQIGQLLGEIAEDEHLAGRPLLSAVAVNSRGKPTDGFYGLAHQLGLLESSDENQGFLQDQRRELYKVWTVRPYSR